MKTMKKNVRMPSFYILPLRNCMKAFQSTLHKMYCPIAKLLTRGRTKNRKVLAQTGLLNLSYLKTSALIACIVDVLLWRSWLSDDHAHVIT